MLLLELVLVVENLAVGGVGERFLGGENAGSVEEVSLQPLAQRRRILEKRDLPSLVGLDGDTVPGRGGLSVHEVDLLERQSLQAEKSSTSVSID